MKAAKFSFFLRRKRVDFYISYGFRWNVVKSKGKCFYFCLGLFFQFHAWGSEIDSFSQRFDPLEDALPGLNQVVNGKLLNSLATANTIKGCSSSRLYQVIKDDFTGPLLGPVEQVINRGNFIEKHVIDRKNSVLADIGVINGSALYFYGLGSIVNLDGHIVGADKFGHFFSEGWTYFKRSVLEEQDLIDVLRFGEASEKGFFGWTMTGVFSYADLAVNYSGLKFWINLIVKEPRVFERNYGLLDPKLGLIECQDEKWVLIRPFDWKSYVDSTWDEAINCNWYPTPEIEELVGKRVSMVMKGRAFNQFCPIDSQQCQEIVKKYGALARYFVHPRCQAEGTKTGR